MVDAEEGTATADTEHLASGGDDILLLTGWATSAPSPGPAASSAHGASDGWPASAGRALHRCAPLNIEAAKEGDDLLIVDALRSQKEGNLVCGGADGGGDQQVGVAGFDATGGALRRAGKV